MVKCENGFTTINGNTPQIMAEMSTLLLEVREEFTKSFGKEAAHEFIKNIYEDSLKDLDDIKSDIEKEIMKNPKNALMAFMKMIEALEDSK